MCVPHRCPDLRAPEEEPGRGAAEAHDALGGAAVHPGQQRLPAVAQPPGRHVSTAQGACPSLALPRAAARGLGAARGVPAPGSDELRGPFHPKPSWGSVGQFIQHIFLPGSNKSIPSLSKWEQPAELRRAEGWVTAIVLVECRQRRDSNPSVFSNLYFRN